MGSFQKPPGLFAGIGSRTKVLGFCVIFRHWDFAKEIFRLDSGLYGGGISKRVWVTGYRFFSLGCESHLYDIVWLSLQGKVAARLREHGFSKKVTGKTQEEILNSFAHEGFRVERLGLRTTLTNIGTYTITNTIFGVPFLFTLFGCSFLVYIIWGFLF